MDPLGFALEQYDAIGRWRHVGDDGTPIDVSGAFPDGTTFDGLPGIRAMLLRDPAPFVTSVTAQVLAYALGRAMAPADAPAIRRIVREAARERYRWSAILRGVVESVPFQMSRTSP
jgi:hypothetical protein